MSHEASVPDANMRPYFAYLRDFGPAEAPVEKRRQADRECLSRLPGYKERLGAETIENRHSNPTSWVALFGILRECRHSYTLAMPDIDEFRHRPDVLRALIYSHAVILVGNRPEANAQDIHAQMTQWVREADEAERLGAEGKRPASKSNQRQPKGAAGSAKRPAISRDAAMLGVEARKRKAIAGKKVLARIIDDIREKEGALADHAIAVALMARQVPAPRGGSRWTGMQVARVLKAGRQVKA